MREQTERDQDHETVLVAGGAQEVEVAAALLGGHFALDGVANLAELELDRGVFGVTVGVVLAEDLQGLVVAVPGNEESGRLGYPFILVSYG